MSAIPEAFRKLGLNLEAALRAVGFNPTILDEPETQVPYSAVDELYGLAIKASGCDHFGLLVGASPLNLGLPGFLATNAPTIRAGLHDLARFLPNTDSGSEIVIAESAGVATLTYSLVAPGVTHTDHICDTALAMGYELLRRVSGRTDFAIEIRFPRRTPADLTPYREYFGGARLAFNCSDAAIEVPSTLLDRPTLGADATLYAFLTRLATQDAAERVEESLAERLRRVLPNLVRHGAVSSMVVANLLSIHPRTLSRRLSEEGVTLQGLVDDARFSVAQQLLRDTDQSLTSVATGLFYSDASAFARAFRKRFGETPGQWRKSNQRTQDTADAALQFHESPDRIQ